MFANSPLERGSGPCHHTLHGTTTSAHSSFFTGQRRYRNVWEIQRTLVAFSLPRAQCCKAGNALVPKRGTGGPRFLTCCTSAAAQNDAWDSSSTPIPLQLGSMLLERDKELFLLFVRETIADTKIQPASQAKNLAEIRAMGHVETQSLTRAHFSAPLVLYIHCSGSRPDPFRN